MSSVETFPLGDSAICVKFIEAVSPELNQRIRQFCGQLEHEKWEGISEWVPAYETVTVYYSPLRTSYQKLSIKLTQLADSIGFSVAESSGSPYLIYLPTLYGGRFGKDLPQVAKANGLSEKEVIDLHTGTDYLVYMMGFLPGFPYLGGMSEEIATPRLENPRSRVPSGSVGIAGEQTGVYPIESPGGWNLIGRTPIKLFDSSREEPFLFQAGDRIRFVPIEDEEYKSLLAEGEAGKCTLRKERIE